MTPRYRYMVEMKTGDPQREVHADSVVEANNWMIFYRNPSQGGKDEYWRVRVDSVACMTTHRN